MCDHHYIIDLGFHVCDLCGLEKPDPVMVDEYRPNILVRRHITYQALEFLEKKTSILCGFACDMALSDREWFRRQMLPCRTWFEVYEKLVHLAREKHLLCVPAAMGHPVYLGALTRTAYRLIYDCGYKLKYPYLCFKWYEMHGVTDLWIPVKCRKATHTRNEREWKRLCGDWGLPYLETAFDALQTPWCKKNPYCETQ